MEGLLYLYTHSPPIGWEWERLYIYIFFFLINISFNLYYSPLPWPPQKYTAPNNINHTTSTKCQYKIPPSTPT
jgi:hypothetical protein